MPQSQLYPVLLCAIAFCGSASADQIILLAPLAFTGVNGYVTQTDSLYVASTSVVYLAAETAFPYDEAPSCQLGHSCLNESYAYYDLRLSSANLGFYDFSDDVGVYHNVWAFSETYTQFRTYGYPPGVQDILTPGSYSVDFAIHDTGDPVYGIPVTTLVGLRMDVTSGDVVITPEPGPAILCLAGLVAVVLRNRHYLHRQGPNLRA